MVEKKEGATMTCHCGTELVCHTKTYPKSDNYPEKTVLQWQNEDGSPHYKFAGTDEKGKPKYNCIAPEPKNESSPPTEHPAPGQQSLDLSSLNAKIDTLTGVCQSILHIVADLKIAQNKEEDSS